MLTAGTLLALLVIWAVMLAAPRLHRRDDTAASIEEFHKHLQAIAPSATMRDVQHPTQRP